MKKIIIFIFVFVFIAFSFAFEKINLNTADEYTLAKVPGIGKLIARRIVEYREKNGKFKKIEELKNIKGIVNERYEAIKDKVYIEERN